MGKTNFKMPQDFDMFAEIMDAAIRELQVQMLITLPEGSVAPEFEDNMGDNPVVQLYLIQNSFVTILRKFRKDLPTLDVEGFVDDILKMVKEDVMQGG